jgi:outer membrane receptor for ferrienterochelin and colicin
MPRAFRIGLRAKLRIDGGEPMTLSASTRGREPGITALLRAAAVAVVTSDPIESSGAMNIPEAIRYVPGINVAQMTASQWAIG